MVSSPSSRRSPRNHPTSIVWNVIGSTARNVTHDFITPANPNAAVSAVTDAAPSSIINNACKTFCDADNCKGFEIEPDTVCILCETAIHGNCFQNQVRKLKEYPEDCHNEFFCTEVCCLWHGNEKVVVADVRTEQSDLQKQLKKTLVDLAQTAKVKITQRIDKKSVQVSKAIIIQRLVAAKFNALIGAPNPTAASPKILKTVHCRFQLLNFIFSDELGALADRSEDVD
jgi:hypothetical protein